MVKYIQARNKQHYDSGKALFQAYQDALDLDLAFEGFQYECDHIESIYGGTQGSLCLAQDGPDYIGCVGLRPINDEICELKRLFTHPSHRLKGIAHDLLEYAIRVAKQLGYTSIVTDTIPKMGAAITLFRKAGFDSIPAYKFNPVQGAVFLEYTL